MMGGFRDLRAIIRDDLRNHGGDWTRPGFRALFWYRVGVWRMTVRNPLLRAPLTLIYRRGFRHARNVYGIELPYTASIGRGVIVEHQGGIVVHGSTVIGDGCIIRQNCTLGLRSLDDLGAAPILGRNVNVGAGAVILGRVHIGDNAAIGANAVVLADVPPDGLAVGVPARVIAR